MKKYLLILLLLVSMATASAQESKYSVATNSFFNNTYIGLGSGYTLRNADFHLSIGKWFTPGIGFRAKATYANGRVQSAYSVQSAECSVQSQEYFHSTNGGHHSSTYGNKALLLSAQTMFNLTNMFLGYRDNRTYCFIPYLGGGLARSCTFNHSGLHFSYGILNTVRLSQRHQLSIEVGHNHLDEGFYNPAQFAPKCKSRDSWFFELGLTVKLGSKKGWKKTPDAEAIRSEMQAELDALNAQLEDERAENKRLQEELEKAK